MKYSNAKLLGTFRLKYTKLLCLKSIFIFLICSCGINKDPEPIDPPIEVTEENQQDGEIELDGTETNVEETGEIEVGAERMEVYLPLLRDKKVGVVGNQSSLIGGTHLVDSLLSRGVNVVKVFSPEHGFRGDADAGEHVNSAIDSKTGLPIVSLYGNNKKPSQEQLQGLDIVVFDIQDVGVRFYTYISTLHYVMEACAEAKIPVLLLDRPNPNGNYVDGPILDTTYSSFIGMHPVPIVYGMTIGEYGKMINGENWLKNGLQCELVVTPCNGYTHESFYSLPVPPSPNLRTDLSIQLYPSLCLLEATTVSIGRGTESPFERYGHPEFPKTEFEFTPKAGPGSKDPLHKNVLCNGYNLTDSVWTRATQLDLSFLLNCNTLLAGKTFIDRPETFRLLSGNNVLIQQLAEGKTEEEIRATWQEGIDAFMKIRAKYLVYE